MQNKTASLEINGSWYDLSTDYRIFTRFCSLATADEVKEWIFDVGLPFCQESINQVKKLYFPPPEKEWEKERTKREQTFVMRYDILEDLIFSAFYKVYGIDLEDIVFLHFSKFQKLLCTVEGTRLNTVFEAWGKNANGKMTDEQKDEIGRIRREYPLGVPELTPEQRKAKYDMETKQIQEELAKKNARITSK